VADDRVKLLRLNQLECGHLLLRIRQHQRVQVDRNDLDVHQLSVLHDRLTHLNPEWISGRHLNTQPYQRRHELPRLVIGCGKRFREPGLL
jgi:hypothetical protein